MALSPSEIPELIVAEDAIIYNTLAASVLVFWEHIITFREEVELIWRSRWNLVSVLFFVIRYTILSIKIFQLMIYTNISGILHPSPTLCKVWVWYEAIPGHIVYVAVEIVLVMRVIAFYGRNKYLTACLITFLVVTHGGALAILLLSLPKFVILPNPLPSHLHLSTCLVIKAPPLLFQYWMLGLALESVLFILLVVRFVQTNHKRASRPHVLIIFARDGAWGFAVIFAALLWSALAFNLTPKKGDIALTWVLSVVGICGSRLILNLRAAAHEAHNIQQDMAIELLSRKQLTIGSVGVATSRTEN